MHSISRYSTLLVCSGEILPSVKGLVWVRLPVVPTWDQSVVVAQHTFLTAPCSQWDRVVTDMTVCSAGLLRWNCLAVYGFRLKTGIPRTISLCALFSS